MPRPPAPAAPNAALPAGAVRIAAAGVALALAAWGASGLARVPMDRRGVAERFGAPAGVLQPGLHAGLPWPIGRLRLVENGAVHDVSLEAPEGVAGGLSLLTPGGGSGAEAMQSVSTSVRILYRVGLDDAGAVRAAFATASPDALVRAAAWRVVTAAFAQRPAAGADGMEAALRTGLQAALDRLCSGLSVLAVVTGPIQPPAGAVAAFQTLHAGEIAAAAGVESARGEAAVLAARSRQAAYDGSSGARAAAYETVAGARTELVRFGAEQQAARAGGASFRLERYLSALSGALARTPKTIIDHRLNYPEAPVLDLRPWSAGPAGADEGGKSAGKVE